MTVNIYHGDCLDVLRGMPDNSVDAIATDPPYGLSNTSPDKVADAIVRWASGDREYIPAGRGFMGSTWDAFVPPPAVWDEVYRVLKPGGHLVAFAGSRTQDLMGISIRLSGMDVRDSISWVAGSGFPKSHNIEKSTGDPKWAGWGTSLKPSHEPVIRAQKPFSVVPLHKRMVADVHHALMGLLWLSLSTAKRAELTSESNLHGQRGETSVSALVNAAIASSRGESAETDTFRSQVVASTSSNIASSWNSILGALSDSMRTSTTEMKSSTTIALRTLNSSLGPITSHITTLQNETPANGEPFSAPSAGPDSSGDWLTCLHTLSASVPETAIDGIALAVESALAGIAESLSASPEAANTALPGATTRAAARSRVEPVLLARKPLSEKTVAANTLTWGTGGLNIDATRIGWQDPSERDLIQKRSGRRTVSEGWGMTPEDNDREKTHAAGRWPANVVLDETSAPVLDEQSGGASKFFKVAEPDEHGAVSPFFPREFDGHVVEPDPPFMYAAKAPKKERPRYEDEQGNIIQHPTTKPLKIMSWLCTLVCPPGGTILDPFAGSGTTIEAALLEGFNVIGIERETAYLPLIQQRIDRANEQLPMAS